MIESKFDLSECIENHYWLFQLSYVTETFYISDMMKMVNLQLQTYNTMYLKHIKHSHLEVILEKM